MSLTIRLNAVIRNVPDFPKPGIQFKDISPLLQDHALCSEVVDAMLTPFKGQKIDVVAGIESRGFLFGVLMAQRLKCAFILVRKEGKLPYNTVSETYDLEYGSSTIEIHTDAIKPQQRVLLHDDLLATGGTAEAASKMINKMGGQLVGLTFLIELEFLKGRSKIQPYTDEIVSLLKY